MTASATAASAPALARAVPGRFGVVLLAAGAFVLLAAAGWVFPRWLTFPLTLDAGNGLVSLGIVALMRGGVVPFGQGMVFAAGGYTAALVYNKLGFTDAHQGDDAERDQAVARGHRQQEGEPARKDVAGGREQHESACGEQDHPEATGRCARQGRRRCCGRARRHALRSSSPGCAGTVPRAGTSGPPP